MNITKQGLNAFLLVSSLVAFSPVAVSAAKYKTRGAAYPSKLSVASRRLQAEETVVTEESAPSIDEDEEETGGSKKSGPSPDSEDDDISVRASSIERECSMDFEGDEAKFKCKAKSISDGGIEFKDSIEFKVEQAKKNNALKIKIKYEEETEDDENDTEVESETEYAAVFDRIIEYRKPVTAVSRSANLDFGSANQEYEWDFDEVVSEWKFDEWSEFTPLETDGDMMTFSASTLGGMATFTFTIHEVGDGMDISANNMKIDFLMENYQWASTDDTFLALVSHIETKNDVDVESKGKDDDALEAEDAIISFANSARSASTSKSFVPFGTFTWADTAEALPMGVNVTEAANATRLLEEQSTTISVVATKSAETSDEEDPDNTYNEIAFSFVGAGRGASRIYWDPEAGVGYNEASAAMKAAGGVVTSLVILASSMALFAF